MPERDVKARIVSTGLFTPPNAISNAELVTAFNAYVEKFNADHAKEIDAGAVEALAPSSVEFIEKASGIKSRYVIDKSGVLDVDVMRPNIPERPNGELSVLADIAVHAAKDALRAADLKGGDIDAVICACSNLQRAYPAVAIEIQEALGVPGYAYDMNVACASAAFGVTQGAALIESGAARRVLVVNPEICSAHLNFKDRDSHFIFGDVATAVILEGADETPRPGSFDVLDTRLKTKFSSNIRNNFGFLNHCDPSGAVQTDHKTDKLFVQQGRKVFKDVVPMVGELIVSHLEDNNVQPAALRRLWLHQANLSMNVLIAKKVLGRDPTAAEAPTILDEYANTSSAGSIIAFHKHRDEISVGDHGVICAFGAGYSAGSVIVRKAA
ncbi:MAG: beta-ketoacyl-ACP synthase III [Pseudomonadota bacterium]